MLRMNPTIKTSLSAGHNGTGIQSQLLGRMRQKDETSLGFGTNLRPGKLSNALLQDKNQRKS